MSQAKLPPEVELPPGWRPEWAPPKRAIEEARRRAAEAPEKTPITTHEETLAALSREAIDPESPAGARVSALRALAELLPPEPVTGGEVDCSRLSDEELDTFLRLLAKCKPEEMIHGPT